MTKLAGDHRKLIATWAQQGHRPGVIVGKLADCGVFVSTSLVSQVLSQERKGGAPIKMFKSLERQTKCKVGIHPSVLERLQPHAARRGIAVETLIGRLAVAVADGDLVDAVLDDELST